MGNLANLIAERNDKICFNSRYDIRYSPSMIELMQKIIAALAEEHGEAWLINTESKVYKKYEGEIVGVDEYKFVVPCYDPKLMEMIEGDNTRYIQYIDTVTMVDEIGGYTLFWN